MQHLDASTVEYVEYFLNLMGVCSGDLSSVFMCLKVYKYRNDFSLQDASMVLLMSVKVYQSFMFPHKISHISFQYENLKS